MKKNYIGEKSKRLVVLLFLMAISIPFWGAAPIISYSGSPKTFSIGTAISTWTPTGGSIVPGGYVSNFASSFDSPYYIAADNNNNIFASNGMGNQIFKINSSGTATLFAGTYLHGFNDATLLNASFGGIHGMAFDQTYSYLYVDDLNNSAIRKINLTTGDVSTLAGNGTIGSSNGSYPTFNFPFAIDLDETGNVLVCDQRNNWIRSITPLGEASTLAGSSQGYWEGTCWTGSTQGTAQFDYPSSIGISKDGIIYIGDLNNYRIRKIANGVTSLFAGCGYSTPYADGASNVATFGTVKDIVVDSYGYLYVSDSGNETIRKITPDGITYTLAGVPQTSGNVLGDGAVAKFYVPCGLALNTTEDVLYVADYYNNAIKKISLYGYKISPALPKGLVFNTITGAISGTPKEFRGSTTYTVTATNSSGSGSTTITFAVDNTTPNQLVHNEKIYVRADRNQVYVENASDESGSIFIFDACGKVIQQAKFEKQEVSPKLRVLPGVYIVKVVTPQYKISRSIIVSGE